MELDADLRYCCIYIYIYIYIYIDYSGRSGSVGEPRDARCGSAVGIATGYGLDGRGSSPGVVKIFHLSTLSRSAMWPTQPPVERVLWRLFLWG
jgi:hypothetical protein